MKWNRNLLNTDAGPFTRPFPVFGGGNSINDGSLLVAGPTAGTNDGWVINPTSATAALSNVIGVAAGTDVNTVSGADTNKTGTNFTLGKVICNPDAIYLMEYNQGSTMAVASVSGTTVTITSLENNITGAWLYAVAGTGAGYLAFVVTSSAGSCVTKTAMPWDATTTLIKILPRFATHAILANSSRDLGTQAAVGGTGYLIWEQYIETDTIPLQMLNPTIHDNLLLPASGSTNLHPHFYSEVIFTAYAASI